MPRLPVHLFAQPALFRIASLIGRPLRLDNATRTLKLPGVARLQVELDVLKERPKQIWIGMGSLGGFWQKIEYENVPPYCTHCWHIGHAETFCHIHHPELRTKESAENPKKGPEETAKSRIRQVYIPKAAKVDLQVTAPASSDPPTIDVKSGASCAPALPLFHARRDECFLSSAPFFLDFGLHKA